MVHQGLTQGRRCSGYGRIDSRIRIKSNGHRTFCLHVLKHWQDILPVAHTTDIQNHVAAPSQMKGLKFTLSYCIPLEPLRSLRIDARNNIHKGVQLSTHGTPLRLPVTDGARGESNIPGDILHIRVLALKFILHSHFYPIDETLRGVEQDTKGILPGDKAHSIFLLIPVKARRTQQPVVEPVFTLVGVMDPKAFNKLDPEQLVAGSWHPEEIVRVPRGQSPFLHQHLPFPRGEGGGLGERLVDQMLLLRGDSPMVGE